MSLLRFKKKEPKAKNLEDYTDEMDKKLEGVRNTALECLRSDLFAKYRLEYAEGEKELITLGIQFSGEIADPVKWGQVSRALFLKLAVLRELNENVEADSEVAR